MLIIWTTAAQSVVQQIIGPALGASRPPHAIHNSAATYPAYSEDDVILCCGSDIVEFLAASGVVPKNRTVNSLRGKPIRIGLAKAFITFSPGIVSRDYSKLPEIIWDVKLSLRFMATGSIAPVPGRYDYVESLHNVIEMVDSIFAMTGKPVEVACDLETLGLDEYNPEAWIISCAFTVEKGKAEILYFTKDEKPLAPPPWKYYDELSYWEYLWVQINWLLTTEKVSMRGANFKYDSRWMVQKWGILCENHKFDTLLVGSLLDENRSNSLKLHAKVCTELGGYDIGMDKHDMGRLDLAPKEDVILYNGFDSDATYQVATEFKAELTKDSRLTNFYTKILHPSSKVFEQLERNGMHVDVPYYQELQDELTVTIARLNETMVSMLPSELRLKHKDSIEEAYADGKNPLKPSILKEFLFTPKGLNLKPQIVTAKTKEPSTSMDHLMMFEDNPVAKEFVGLLREHGSASKTLSTYVVGFLKHLRSDGKFHPHYMLFRGGYGEEDDSSGTVTGRSSAKDPAVQCQVGGSLIFTLEGNKTILSIVAGFERGESFTVLTHTGEWRKVVGVYRNGVKPVYRVTTKSRFSLTCTENHPLLSSCGFIRTDSLLTDDNVFVMRGWGSEADVQFTGDGIREINRYRVQQDRKEVELPMRVWEGSPSHEPDASEREYEVMRVLQVGETDNSRAQHPSQYLQNLRGVVPHDSEVHQPEEQGLRSVHGEGDYDSTGVDGLREFPKGHGRGSRREEFGQVPEQGRELRARQLPMGNSVRTGEKSENQCPADIQRGDEDKSGMGRGDRAGYEPVLPLAQRVERDSGTHHALEAEEAGFSLEQVVSIEYRGEEETYDLTIENCHSFVANGIVVHNTIPKHTKWTKKLRRAFTAPPGYTILEIDFSQGELRIAAVVAKEPTMIQAYLDGQDLHAITAAAMNGYELDEFMQLDSELFDALRSGGKAGNFGLLYGMMAAGFRTYAYTTYGVVMTSEEAEMRRNGFFEKYARLLDWHEECKQEARDKGFIRSPLGRVRHLPLIHSKDRETRSQAERQSINSCIQATLSDMMQYAMVLVNREYGNDIIKMFIMTHDSVGCYVPIEDAKLWAKRLKVIMDNLPLKKEFGWDSPLSFPVDAQIAEPDADGIISLANMKKVKDI